MRQAIIIFVAGLFSTPSLAQVRPVPGTDLGNGGDKLRERFTDARYIASDIVKAVSAEGVEGSVARDLLEDQRQELVDDISYSQHVWGPNPATGCWQTQAGLYRNIDLSYTNCRPLDLNQAIVVVLKASAQHLAVDEDDLEPVVRDLLAAFTQQLPAISSILGQTDTLGTRTQSGLQIKDLVGSYVRHPDEPVFKISDLGQLEWPLVVAISEHEFHLKVSQFLTRDSKTGTFGVKGQISLPSGGGAGVSRACSLPVSIVLTPNHNATVLEVELTRPESVSRQCETRGKVVAAFTLRRAQ